MEPSPYLPTSRRFVNPMYVRVEDVPEVAYLAPEQRAEVEACAAQGRALTQTDHIDRDAAWTLKDKALRLVYRVPAPPRRAMAFEAFCDREGQGLRDFATWCAIATERGISDWPEELEDVRSAAVAAEAERLADEVRYHLWLQWVMEDQQEAVQRLARDCGMTIGVMADLAVGVHPEGADAWALGDVLAQGVTVGAPPDPYNQLGQNWSQPPWRPDRLAEAGYAPFRDMIRASLRHSGALRIDHVIGLFRLWWVPEGHSPVDGHVRAVRPRRAGRHPRAGGASRRGDHRGRGPGDGRAVGARLPARTRDPRHLDPVVRADRRRRRPPRRRTIGGSAWPR